MKFRPYVSGFIMEATALFPMSCRMWGRLKLDYVKESVAYLFPSVVEERQEEIDYMVGGSGLAVCFHTVKLNCTVE